MSGLNPAFQALTLLEEDVSRDFLIMLISLHQPLTDQQEIQVAQPEEKQGSGVT